MKEKWDFEHDEFECGECRSLKGAYKLNFYLGTHKGRDAHKYECSNKECGFVEIKTFDEMTEGAVKVNKIQELINKQIENNKRIAEESEKQDQAFEKVLGNTIPKERFEEEE